MAWSGFHKRPHAERLALVQAHAALDEAAVRTLAASGLPAGLGGTFIENHVGAFPLPLGFAVGFDIDGTDTVVPMAVEESSVIAAACHGAKLAGRFTTEADAPTMIGQIEVRSPAKGLDAVAQHKEAWMESGNQSIPSMVTRGGGIADITARNVGERIVVHLHVDCRDAMGANLVNSLCETLAADVGRALGGTVGLRILSNLADQRTATATFRTPVDRLGGLDVAEAIVAANDFAMADPYRAATHNKGIMNGIDPVVIATGNDWRAIEAGAHAFAARDGAYRALTSYHIEGDALHGSLRLPMALGTVGGVTALHPTASACLDVLGRPDAQRLARITVAVGLAQNLSALRALATEGIQRGHMALHSRNAALRKRPEP